ncbi:bacteriohemerythrin [Azonexus sp.]|uniref:bacteriohemerythrin n=1 Tax=Azonexus sp. TaxID=1872668 RepID=UPI0035B46D84
MDTFIWSERFVTGQPQVDDEHQELVRLINRVGTLSAGESGAGGQIADILEALVDYAAVHFAHEEELMERIGCDPRHVDLHKKIHADFASQIVNMRAVSSGPSDIEYLLRFLSNWLAYHILGTDQAMVRQFRDIESGLTPAEAYAAEEGRLADPATGSLLDALNGLYRVLGRRNQVLVDLNRQLEERVERRTAELQQSNRRLTEEDAKLKEMLARLEATQQQLVESERKRAALGAQGALQQMLTQIVDGDPVPTLVIDASHRVTHWNKACAVVTGLEAAEMVGRSRHWAAFYPDERPILADLVVDGAGREGLETFYRGKCRASPIIDGAYEAEDFFPHLGAGGRWLYFTAAPLRDAGGRIIGAVETLQDVTERHRAEDDLRSYQAHLEELVGQRTAELREVNRQLQEDNARRELAEAELRRRYTELTELNIELSETREQLIQSEKLASIGQLAAGVAHEINNPIGYVHSNLGTLESYIADLFRLLGAYEAAAGSLPADAAQRIAAVRAAIDVDFLREDMPSLLGESKEGIDRVKKIIQDLKDFSRVDSSQEWQWANLHQGLESTINIAANELKYKADVIREYGMLPEVECLPSQLNQVFMNLLVNAAQAMGAERGRIVIRTGCSGDRVWLEFADNGSGMSESVRQRVFDPFFTTKPVGKGTGLGLSLSYGIIRKHDGTIDVTSEPGRGTTFRIELPVRHVRKEGEGEAR